MTKGVVMFFLEKKGYGYIRVPKTREEFYVQKNQLAEPVKKGDLVSFEIKEDKHGLRAVNVRLEK